MVDEEIVTFGYVPMLGPGPGTLMPRTGGLPGVKYAQICTNHVIKARRYGWDGVRDAEPYIISGPAGEAECMLMCQGKPIRNASPMGGSQVCELDREIFVLTGFEDPDGDPEDSKKPDKPEGTQKGGKDVKGDTGIQARQPSV